METIWSAALGTPWWVYALLLYLITIGIKASKSHVVSLQQLFILPLIFSILSISSIMDLSLSIVTLTSWGIAVLLGILLGWMFVKRLEVRVDKKQRLIEMPGTWSTLLIILAIFASKYYIGYRLDINPDLAGIGSFQMWIMSVSGACMGLLLGRLFYLLNCFRMEEHVHLEKV